MNLLSKIVLKQSHKHPFHIVDPSPWPFYTSFALFFILFGAAAYFNGYGAGLLRVGLFLLFFYVSRWFIDILNEGTIGKHSVEVQEGFFFGFKIFVFSEAMIFFGLIWAFLHSAIVPTLAGGYAAPSYGFGGAPEDGLASVNSLLLFWSSLLMYGAEISARNFNRKGMRDFLLVTGLVACVFSFVQYCEFQHIHFNFNDGALAGAFYLLIGLHASHVFLGGLTILFCAFLAAKYYTAENHVTFDCIQYYWHFVDWVWLFVVTYGYSETLYAARPAFVNDDVFAALF